MPHPPRPPDLPSGLGRTHGADLRLVALLADLRGNVAAAGLPAHGHNEIGQFIELLAEAFGAAVGANGAVNVNAWHKHIPDAHPATFNPLWTAYGHRNIASHANAERELLSDATVATDLQAVHRLLPVVVAELDLRCRLDLLAHIDRLAEQRRWRRTTSGTYRRVTAQHAGARPMHPSDDAAKMPEKQATKRTAPPPAATPHASRPTSSVPAPAQSMPASHPESYPAPTAVSAGSSSPVAGLVLVGGAIVAFLAVLVVGGFFLFRSDAHATAADVVSEWTVGSRWVYRSSVEVPIGYPDEHRAAEALTERELVEVRPTKIGVELAFTMRGGDSDKRGRRVLWRVESDCIESLSPRSRTVRERACRVPEESTEDRLVFRSRTSSWKVHLKPGVGPTLLSWTHPTRGYTTARDLKYAKVGPKVWGDPAIRALTCDWRISSTQTNTVHRLSDGLACSAVVVRAGQPSWQCNSRVSPPELVGNIERVKVFSDSRGIDWVAAVQREHGQVRVDLCRVDGRTVACHRVVGPPGSKDWSVWTVSAGSQCRFRIAENRARKTNKRRVATWDFAFTGPKRVGGTLPMRMTAR